MLQSQATRLTVTVPYVHTISTDGAITLYGQRITKGISQDDVTGSRTYTTTPEKGIKGLNYSVFVRHY